MTKLTATQQRILDHMLRLHGRYTAVVRGVDGPARGRNTNEGLREYNACKHLVTKGLAICDRETAYMIRNQRGRTESCKEIAIHLPGLED